MAANIEQIFRDFVVNKIKEIEDESQDIGPPDDGQPGGIGSHSDQVEVGAKENTQDKDKASVVSTKEEVDVPHKKHKKHKKHKSKKAKKKKKEEKGSSSASAVESDGETQHGASGREGRSDKAKNSLTVKEDDGRSKRHKRHSGKKKKKKRKKDEDKAGSSSPSGSESESESKPSSKTQPATKESECEDAKQSSVRDGVLTLRKPQELPDIIPKLSPNRSSSGRRRSRSRSRSARRHQRSKSRSRNRKSRSGSPKHGRRSRSRMRSRSRSGRRGGRRTRSRSRQRRSGSRSGRRTRRTRSRSVVILKRDRRTRSRSRNQTRNRSRSRSRTSTRRSDSRLRSQSTQSRSNSKNKSKSRSVPRDEELTQKDPCLVDNEASESVKETEPVKKEETLQPSIPIDDPTMASENSTDGVLNVVAASGGWKPVPFLDHSSSSAKTGESTVTTQPSECQTSPQKCPIPPEVPLSEELEASHDDQQLSVPPSGEEEGSSSTQSNPQPTTGEAESTVKEECSSRSNTPSRQKPSKSRSPSERKELRSESPVAQKKRVEGKSSTKKKRSRSRSPAKKKKSRSSSRGRKRKSKSRTPSRKKRSRSKSGTRKKKSRSKSRTRAKRSKSRSPRRKRSKSRSPTRRSKRSRSRSDSRRRRGMFGSHTLSQRDRWKREPSHSPVLILRKKRSPTRTHHTASKSPSRLTELDKDQLLEIAKANAAAMCAKAGMPIPESLKPKAVLQLPLPIPSSNNPLALPMPMSMPMPMNLTMNAALASMTAATMTAALTSMGALTNMHQMPPLPTITNKPPPGPPQPNLATIEDVKRKVAKQANIISIKEFTDKCKKIVESKGELAIAQPHVSDDEDDGKPFGGAALREVKGISFSLNNASVRPSLPVTARSDAAFAKEFPVSSGSQHRKKEGEGAGAYGEWVPVDKKAEKAKAAAAAKAALGATAAAKATPAGETATATVLPTAAEEPVVVKESDSVFPEPPSQPVDITQAVSERIKAQRRLADNPYDVSAMCMLNRAQEQVDAWAQSNTIPGLFTGSTGAQVLSSEELSNSGPQAWIKKDQFLRAAPVSGGVGEFLMRKMGWRTGEGLGRHREGTVEPIVIDFKTDRKGLVAEGEKPQRSGGLVVTKDLLGKHPVSALMELCNKKRWIPPDFVMVHHSGPDHRKNFLFKVVVNGAEYQPQSASPNKKHAKAMAATVALQAMGEVAGDTGLFSGPVFTAASTGPLFSSSSNV